MKNIILFLSIGVVSLFALSPSSYIDPYFSKTRGAYYKGGVDNTIIHDITKASSSIKMAMYYLTNRHITKALIKAHKRGVRVEVVTDDKKKNSKRYRELKKAGIDIKDDNNKKALMHNKILIVDDETVWIGSANYTVYSFYRNHDNFLRIKDKDIASYYDDKFTKIYKNDKSSTDAYISEDKKIEIYFSPDANFENRVVSLIRNAKDSINFLAFAFTNSKIADALIQASKRGVQVRGVFDKAQDKYQKYSKYEYLKENALDVILDKNRFKLHSKLIIIDKKLVITGSYNFTKQANSKNDENSIVVFDAKIASRYTDNFYSIYNAK